MKSGFDESLPLPPEGRLDFLFATHAHDAKRLAYLMTGDVGLAEDLAQEAFVRVSGRLGHLRDPDRFKAYLRKTVVNLARSYFRKNPPGRITRPATEDGPLVEERDVEAELDLRVALSFLPYRQRAALVLRYYADLADEETAELLGCRRTTVRSLVARGLETLRERVEVIIDE